MSEDWQLLDDYAERGSELGFRALVERHIGLVHAAALRQVQDRALAEEICQAVFTLLARKASSLPRRTVLAGWLFRTTSFVASRAIRAELRRQRREQEAASIQELSVPDEAWRRLAPDLDEALMQLSEGDRTAVLLRFFEDKDYEQVAIALGIGGEAAKKRVNRGLQKLRVFFARRGFQVSAATVALFLATNGATAAPAGLAGTVASAAFAGGVAASGVIAVLVRETLAAWRWTKVGLAGAGALAGVGIAAVLMMMHAVSQPPSVQAAAPTKPPILLPLRFANNAFAGRNDDRFLTDVDPNTKRTPNSAPAGYIKSLIPLAGPDSPDYLRLRATRILYLPVTQDSPVRGKRIRLTVWAKTRDVDNWAGFALNIHDLSGKIFANDEMTDHPIHGTTDWQQYQIVSDVPPEACILEFGAALNGTGELWTDDFQIDVTSTNTPITDDRIWHKWSPNAADYSVTVDYSQRHDGHPTLRLAFTPEGRAPRGSWMWWGQCIRAPEKYNGHTVRMTVWIKSEKASGNAGINLRPKGPNFKLLTSDDPAIRRHIRGTTDWIQKSVFCEIPSETQCLDTGFYFNGSGKIWIDMQSLQYELIDGEGETPGK